MDKQRIGFDVDGVIYPWHEVILDFTIQARLLPKTATLYDFWGKEAGFWARSSQAYKDMLVNNTLFYDCARPYEGVLEVILELADDFDVYYLTARPSHLAKRTVKWFHRYNFPNPNKVFLTKKSKRHMVGSLITDYYVDDRVDYLEELKDLTQAIHLVRPWSENYYDDKVIRIDNFPSLLTTVYGR